VEAVGRCALDLNRLSREVAALQNLAPTVCLLWSDASLVLGSAHDDQAGLVYEAATFWASRSASRPRRSSPRRRGPEAAAPARFGEVLLLPDVTHLPDESRAGLDKLREAGVRVLACGEAPLRNDWNQPRESGDLERLPACGDSKELFALLAERAAGWSLPAALRLQDESGRPVYGVEIRSAALGGGRVASVCNHLREPVRVALAGAEGKALTDLITGKSLGSTFTAEPMTPLL
jgi:hypothetical protein